jgi:sensor histidine kinase YesM
MFYLQNALLLSSSILIIVLIIHIRLQGIASSKKISALEQRLLLSQMNPHFVFNSLTAIQSYIFRNDAYTAGKYMSSFAKLVRLVLENSRQETISLAKEIETIRYYLLLQELRFEGRFEYHIEVDPDINAEELGIPPMLAQPFIENAIEHGIIHLSTKGLITIRYLLSANNLFLEIEDNGIGIEKSSQLSQSKWTEHRSLATKITNERLRNIRRSKKLSVGMELIDLTTIGDNSQRGTLVRFLLPVQLI